MQTKTILLTGQTPTVAKVVATDLRQCNGLIVHEDLPTELLARRVWNQLVNEMGREIHCAVTYQSAEQIKESLDFEWFSRTDIVIISVRDLALFFFGQTAWLTDWLNVKSCLPRALFILHDGEEDNEVIGFLRTISEFAGVSLFSRGREAHDHLRAMSQEHVCQPEEDFALVS